MGGDTSVRGDCPTNVRKVTSEGGVFVHDRLNIDRLTVSAACASIGSTRKTGVPPRAVAADAEPELRRAEVLHHAIQGLDAQVAAAYDLFGDGRTVR